MRLHRNLTYIILSFVYLLFVGCSSGGGDGATASTDINIAGTWTIDEISKQSNCDNETPTETFVLQVAQTGTSSSISITDIKWNETFNGTLNDHTLTWSGSFTQDANGIAGITTLHSMTATIDASCNSLSGTASWTWTATEPPPYSCSGTTTFTGTRNPAIGCGSTTAVPVAAPVSYDFENGIVPTTFVMSGDAGWIIDSANGSGGSGKSLFADGFASAVGAKGCVAITVSGATNITFDYMVSSEANFDFLRFYVDNVLQGEDSGIVSWTNASHSEPVSGTYEFKWCYEKDDAVVDGLDTAWIDNLIIN